MRREDHETERTWKKKGEEEGGRKEGEEGGRVRGRTRKVTLHLLRQGQSITHSKGNPLLIHSFWDCGYTGEEHFPFLLQLVRDLAMLF